MTKSYAILAIIAPMLIASVGLKTVFEVDYYVAERGAITNIDIEHVFAGTAFQFQPSGELGEYIGIQGACIMIAGPSNRDGDSDAIFVRRYQPAGARIHYLYDGAITATPPYLRAQVDNYVQRLKVAIGRRPIPNLMFHLALNGDCRPADFSPLVFEPD
jgi:hypothetical protein